MVEQEKFLFACSPELKRCLDIAKGERARNPFVEELLWRSGIIRNAARQAGIRRPDRPTDGRGRSRNPAGD